jgi:hypothetical protein
MLCSVHTVVSSIDVSGSELVSTTAAVKSSDKQQLAFFKKA